MSGTDILKFAGAGFILIALSVAFPDLGIQWWSFSSMDPVAQSVIKVGLAMLGIALLLLPLLGGDE